MKISLSEPVIEQSENQVGFRCTATVSGRPFIFRVFADNIDHPTLRLTFEDEHLQPQALIANLDGDTDINDFRDTLTSVLSKDTLTVRFSDKLSFEATFEDDEIVFDFWEASHAAAINLDTLTVYRSEFFED